MIHGEPEKLYQRGGFIALVIILTAIDCYLYLGDYVRYIQCP